MADTIPTDLFSRSRREVADNPGALVSGSTVDLRDFYGNLETWVIETARLEAGVELCFLTRNAQEGGSRLVLPVEVMAAIRRHQESNLGRAIRRRARRSVETKRAKGIPVGNPAALAKARRSRRRK